MACVSTTDLNFFLTQLCATRELAHGALWKCLGLLVTVPSTHQSGQGNVFQIVSIQSNFGFASSFAHLRTRHALWFLDKQYSQRADYEWL
jgi:hypothetical protein